MSDAETPADVAFTMFLAGFDPAMFSDYEYRVYRYARLMAIA